MKTKDQVLLEQAYNQINESTEFQSVISDLERGIPGPNIFKNLQSVKDSGKVNDLIRHLNSLGELDERDWFLKDNLIKALFMGLTKEEI